MRERRKRNNEILENTGMVSEIEQVVITDEETDVEDIGEKI